MKPRRPTASYTDQQRDVQRALAGLETQFSDLRQDKGQRELGRQEIAPKRARAKQVVTPASESQILKAIMSLLRTHPKVAKVWRQNSGVAQYGDGEKTRYVRANTARGMADIQAIMKNGKSVFIEVKTAIGKVEDHQQQFLDDMTKAGALAFVARDVETVTERLRTA